MSNDPVPTPSSFDPSGAVAKALRQNKYLALAAGVVGLCGVAASFFAGIENPGLIGAIGAMALLVAILLRSLPGSRRLQSFLAWSAALLLVTVITLVLLSLLGIYPRRREQESPRPFPSLIFVDVKFGAGEADFQIVDDVQTFTPLGWQYIGFRGQPDPGSNLNSLEDARGWRLYQGANATGSFVVRVTQLKDAREMRLRVRCGTEVQLSWRYDDQSSKVTLPPVPANVQEGGIIVKVPLRAP